MREYVLEECGGGGDGVIVREFKGGDSVFVC